MADAIDVTIQKMILHTYQLQADEAARRMILAQNDLGIFLVSIERQTALLRENGVDVPDYHVLGIEL